MQWAVPPSPPAIRSRSFAPQANLPLQKDLALKNGAFTISVPPQGLVLIMLSAHTAEH